MIELEALEAMWPQLRALGALSPQVPQYGRVRRRTKLEFDVLTDLDLRVAEAFGLVFTLPTALSELYAAFGNTLDKLTMWGGADYERLGSARDSDRWCGTGDVGASLRCRVVVVRAHAPR